MINHQYKAGMLYITPSLHLLFFMERKIDVGMGIYVGLWYMLLSLPRFWHSTILIVPTQLDWYVYLIKRLHTTSQYNNYYVSNSGKGNYMHCLKLSYNNNFSVYNCHRGLLSFSSGVDATKFQCPFQCHKDECDILLLFWNHHNLERMVY